MMQNRSIGGHSRAVTVGKGIVKTLDSLVNFAVLIIFLLLMLYGCYALWDTNQIYRAADHRQFSMYKPPAADGEDALSFDELRNINPDVFSWLTVYGTNIDYPVVQGADNEIYVNTNVMGEFSLSGNLFLDSTNERDFSDHNSIIYGHHMEKNAMFGDLDKFMDETYFSERMYGDLYYDGKHHGLEFFAFLEADVYDTAVYYPGVPEELEQTYLDGILEKAKYTRDTAVTAEDQLILLSTCVATSTNGRHILVGRLTDETFINTLDQETETQTNPVRSVDSQSWFSSLRRIPTWAWALLALLLAAILLHLLGKKTRKRAHGKVVA